MFEHIAVAFSGTDASIRALDRACRLAFQAKIGLLVMLIDQMPFYSNAPEEPDEFSKYSLTILRELRRRALVASAHHNVPIDFEEVTASMLSDYIRGVHTGKLDLLVVGQQKPGLCFRLFGGFAEDLVRDLDCSILVVR